MQATLRDVLSRFNAGTMYGKLEVQIGSEYTPEHELGRLALIAAIEHVRTAEPSDVEEVEFEIAYDNGKTSIFYLDYTY
jgi:hypothetical protein